MKLRAIIVDDDGYAIQNLESSISRIQDIHLLASFTDPRLSIPFIKENKPDLLFLDIRMPGMSGFDLMDEIYNDVGEVIFVTGYNEYAITALRYSALDYLLKPATKEDIEGALKRYYQRTEKILTQSKILNLKQNLNAEKTDFELVLLTKSEGEKRFRAADIMHCEADSNYSQIFLTKGRRFTASKTLSDLENLLDPNEFIRIHKSHLVNKNHIKGIGRENDLTLSDGTSLPISRRRILEVRTIIGG
ncbi:MAG: LytR/AlgR family response regulator transcription factor [Flavobacteriales bacterium]|jgi:two-component system LytT family response regulator